MRFSRLWDRERSPLAHLPWTLAIGLRAAPLELPVRVITLLIRFSGPALVLLTLQGVIDAVSTRASLTGPLLALAAAAALTEVGTAVSKNFDTRIEEKMGPFVQEMVLAKAARLSLVQFEEPSVHDLIARVSKERGVPVFDLMSDTIWFLAELLGGLSSLFLLLRISLLVALAACLAAVPIAWAGVRQGSRLHQMERSQTPIRRFSDYLGRLLSTREPATELRAYQLEEHFLKRWREAFRRRRAEALRVRLGGVLEGWLAGTAAAALFALALWQLSLLARQGRVGAGDFVVIVGAVRILQGIMTNSANAVGQLWQMALPVAELKQFLTLPTPDASEAATAPRLPFPAPLAAPIRFENVRFTYPGRAEPVLNNLNLTIHPGERIALVGVNGAGKSTLVKLLLGLYRPEAGRITIGGVDLAEIDPADLAAHMSCVFQDFVRYEMTLRENIRFGRLDGSESDVAAAVQSAGLTDLVVSLPDGLDTLLGKTFAGGTGLSGGQWQRVAMARAFIRSADVILLDEPTAALDPRAELAVFGQFIELVRGKTAVLISHRLGSARLADRIIVLGDGRVLEDGSHADLLAAGGQYAQLFQIQAQWYEDEVAAAAGEEVVPQ